MGAFASMFNSEQNSAVDFLDQSAFDEKFEIELDKDYISNLYHIENKYLVPVLSGGYRDMYEYCRKNLIHPDDRTYEELMNPDTIMDLFRNSADNTIKSEFRHKMVDGSYRWVQYLGITGAKNGVPEGKIYFYIYDIQNQKNRLNGISVDTQYKNDRDKLTGLEKSVNFVSAIIRKTKETSEESWCCIAIDIQHFKIFNSWFGYEKGDYLLSAIGEYLRGLETDDNAVAGYFGRDNFGLFIPYDKESIQKIYITIRDLVFSYSNMAGFLPAFGVYILSDNETPDLHTYDNARLAVEDAKKSYMERICYFDSSEYENTRKNFEFLSAFQSALMNNEIGFYIQPQCRITDGKIVGGEALSRWIRKDGSIINPGQYIPFLESTGFITELDKHTWKNVCKWIRSLVDYGITPLPISINVSQIDLLSMDVASYLYSLTEVYDISPKFLKVEITESAYAENYNDISNTISLLKKRGFSVFLDDFGSGYSSLSMLDNINVDVIKLDMLFMKKENGLGKKGIGIVESIFGMTKTLELPVIVEGVETDDQVRFLINLGFKYAQGYYFYKPVSVEKFEELLQDSLLTDHSGLQMATSDLFRAQEFLEENMFTESTLNRILGAVAYYSLDGKNLTISRFNEPFRKAIGDDKMDSRIENIQNYIVSLDHQVLYNTLDKAVENQTEGSKCEIRFYKSDGSVFWFHMHFYFLRNDGNKKLFFGKVEDITEQRQQSLHFFDVLRKQSDVTMRIELDKNLIQYVTGDNTLYNFDLPSMDLDRSIEQTAIHRIGSDKDRQAFLEFFDGNRLKDAYNKAIYHEVLNIDFRLSDKVEPVEFSTYYIRHNRDDSLIVYAFTKRRDREIMRIDSLTGMKNRYAYNEEISRLKGLDSDSLIVFSMDLNNLKFTNDTYGHPAGDELIKTAANTINTVFGSYGKTFRIGGDEFAAFVHGDKQLAKQLLSTLDSTTSSANGTSRDISLSCGYAAVQEFPEADIFELIKIADTRMYQAKAVHYQNLGVDRRMDQVAYSAICNSYTKVLYIDLTNDSFEIIRAVEDELDDNKGFSNSIFEWLKQFAYNDQVHPEDKEYYLKHTSKEYLKEFFKSGNRHYSLHYRRKINDTFTKVLMEIMIAPDYTDDNQKLFMYVKNIGSL